MNRLNDLSRRSHLLPTVFLIAAVLSSSSGCRLCCNDDDAAYPAYGGKWRRTSRDSGRVGSVFQPGGAMVADLSPRDSVPQPNLLYDNVFEGSIREDTELERPRDSNQGQDEEEFQRQLEEFQKKNFQEINVVPGEPTPPDFR